MKGKRSEGFTLVEVVVVIAVVAILAAILAPSIVKHIDDSKVARAASESKVIAAAVSSFYKDVGQWPTAPDDSVEVLVTSEGTLPAGLAGDWNFDPASDAEADYFEDHLVVNNPKAGPPDYPATGKNKWKGPYQTVFSSDPWGNMYLVNIGDMAASPEEAVWVISAGPNRTMDTGPDQLLTAPPVLAGDDIGFRVK